MANAAKFEQTINRCVEDMRGRSDEDCKTTLLGLVKVLRRVQWDAKCLDGVMFLTALCEKSGKPAFEWIREEIPIGVRRECINRCRVACITAAADVLERKLLCA